MGVENIQMGTLHLEEKGDFVAGRPRAMERVNTRYAQHEREADACANAVLLSKHTRLSPAFPHVQYECRTSIDLYYQSMDCCTLLYLSGCAVMKSFF